MCDLSDVCCSRETTDVTQAATRACVPVHCSLSCDLMLQLEKGGVESAADGQFCGSCPPPLHPKKDMIGQKTSPSLMTMTANDGTAPTVRMPYVRNGRQAFKLRP